MRRICPQVAGLYQSNDYKGKYRFLYVPNNNPDSEWWVMAVYLCDKHGNISPETQFPIAVAAEGFGDYVEL